MKVIQLYKKRIKEDIYIYCATNKKKEYKD